MITERKHVFGRTKQAPNKTEDTEENLIKKEIVERSSPLVHDTVNATMNTNIRQITRIGICTDNVMKL